MGQVPRAKPWLLLGDGRLALHLKTYLRLVGIPSRQWSRRHGWHDCARTDGELSAYGLKGFSRVLLAIRDDALAGFVARHADTAGPPWVHFSGSRRLDGVWSAHPLCTFGPEPYDLEVYSSIPWVVEREGPPLAELLPGLPNPSIAMPGADKALYHALCVAAGNFTTLLWQRFFSELAARWGFPPETAIPYLRQLAANLESVERENALTGPMARGDRETMRRNIEALEAGDLADLARIYRAFAESARRDAGRPAA